MLMAFDFKDRHQASQEQSSTEYKGTYMLQMGPQAVIRPGFDGQSNAAGVGLLAEAHSLSHARGGMPRQRIVQAPHKVVPVLCWQRHEGASHQDELHLPDHRQSSVLHLLVVCTVLKTPVYSMSLS